MKICQPDLRRSRESHAQWKQCGCDIVKCISENDLKTGTAGYNLCFREKPRIIFFVGPTGVGKTTTIAKIASKYKLEMGMKIAFLTADTYRIAATEQLRVYANILDAPMSIIYSAEEMNAAIERVSEYDLIFVDTAGFSHKNDEQCNDMKKCLQVWMQHMKERYIW